MTIGKAMVTGPVGLATPPAEGWPLATKRSLDPLA